MLSWDFEPLAWLRNLIVRAGLARHRGSERFQAVRVHETQRTGASMKRVHERAFFYVNMKRSSE